VLIEAAGWRSIYTQFGAITSLNRANEVMAILLGKYANIEAQNKMGRTALMIAAQRKNKEALEFLLSKVWFRRRHG